METHVTGTDGQSALCLIVSSGLKRTQTLLNQNHIRSVFYRTKEEEVN